MLHRLCGSPSIPLSFILANVLPRWNTYCVCCGTEELCSPTPSIHRLRRGLPGYLILFAPHAFEPQRQLPSSKPPSPLVFLLISTHFTATLGIPPTSTSLKTCSFKRRYRLSRYISRLTCLPAYAPFTPSNSGQRLPPTYYRGCWHVVSRGLLLSYRHYSSLRTEVYNPKTVFLHAALLHQACAHCAIFPTAASRRSLGRISVPMWPVALSGRLPVVGSVGRYPADYLIGRDPIPYR